MTVDTEKYTYDSNRGSPPTVSDNMEPSQDSLMSGLLSNMTATRQQYTKLLVDIASTRGNVLVCMPSYSEAEWAKSMIEIAGVGDSKDIVLTSPARQKRRTRTWNRSSRLTAR